MVSIFFCTRLPDSRRPRYWLFRPLGSVRRVQVQLLVFEGPPLPHLDIQGHWTRRTPPLRGFLHRNTCKGPNRKGHSGRRRTYTPGPILCSDIRYKYQHPTDGFCGNIWSRFPREQVSFGIFAMGMDGHLCASGLRSFAWLGASNSNWVKRLSMFPNILKHSYASPGFSEPCPPTI